MKRSAVNMVVDALGVVGLVVLTSTGLVLEYLLPPRSGRWRSVLGMTRHEWGTFHLAVAALFFATLAIHLILHWRWIVGVIRGRSTEGSALRFVLGVVGLATLLLIALIPWLSGVDEAGGRGG
jgi:hypothetical protein